MANLVAMLSTNIIGVSLLLGLLVTSRMARSRSNLDDNVFTAIILVCMGACICEPLAWLMDGRAGDVVRVVSMLCNSYCYLAIDICAYLWVLYVELRLNRADRMRHWYPGFLVSTVAFSLLVAGNVFGGYLFTLDANNVYVRQPLAFLNYALAFIMLLFSVYLRNKYQRERNSARFFPTLLFIAPVILGTLLQATHYGLSTGWPSVCVGLSLIYMSQQNELAYVDQLTGLYNRTYLNFIFSRMRLERHKGGSGIMIDIDYFKEINDTFGHSAGDDALRRVARIIEKGVPKGAICIRFAGDEFIVLIDSSDPVDVIKAEKGIRAKLEEENASGSIPYTLSLSMGYSIFEVENDTAETFMDRMDSYMYREKEQKHATR